MKKSALLWLLLILFGITAVSSAQVNGGGSADVYRLDTINGIDLGSFGYDENMMVITLFPDGRVSILYDGKEADSESWEQDGENIAIHADGNVLRGTLNNDTLALTVDGTEMVLKKASSIGKDGTAGSDVDPVYLDFLKYMKDYLSGEDKEPKEPYDRFGTYLYDMKRNDWGVENTGYALLDIDRDGTPELLLGDCKYKRLYDVYTVKNGRIREVLHSGYKNVFTLFTDGTVSEEKIISAYSSESCFYIYTNGELSPLLSPSGKIRTAAEIEYKPLLTEPELSGLPGGKSEPSGPEAGWTAAEKFIFEQIDETTCRITGFTGDDQTIIIPASGPNGCIVTEIGEGAFANNISLISVTIPGSVASIGNLAFSLCIRLTSAVLADGVTSIGDFAFSGCIGLTSINFPESITSIGNYAFTQCSSLAAVTLPETISFIGKGAFDPSAELDYSAEKDGPEPPAENMPAAEETPEVPVYIPAVGDLITFGRYEQDNNKANGSEPIEWKVAAAAGSADGFPSDENVVLLVSTKVLDAMAFDTMGMNSWDISSLRKWMQNVFFYDAFTDSERRAIRKVSHKAGPQDSYPDTDTVFILSMDEIRRFLPNPPDRQFSATPYAVAQKVYRGSNGLACWWTRTYYSKGVAYNIWSDGNMEHGSKVTERDGGILPAVWISLDDWAGLP